MVGTMTAIALAVSAAGIGMDAIGKKKAGNAAARAAESQAQQFEFNAKVADMQAQDAASRGVEEESRFRQQVRSLQGSQVSGFAGQGVDVAFGSAGDVAADTAFLGELDAQTVRANTQREVWGFQVEADDLRRGAATARLGGAAARTAGTWGAASSVVGGSGSLLLSRYGWDQKSSTKKAPIPSTHRVYTTLPPPVVA